MNTLQKAIMALATGILVSAGAKAAVVTAQPYVGAKIGLYDVDQSGADDATSYGVYGGAKFTSQFGFEAEYLTTSDADRGVNEEYSADTYGVYTTYNYMVPNTALYAKARLGLANNEVNIKSSGKNMSVSDTGIAGGLGVGYKLADNVSIEALYNKYPTISESSGDMDMTGITLGAHFTF